VSIEKVRDYNNAKTSRNVIKAQCVCQLIEVGHDAGGKFSITVSTTQVTNNGNNIRLLTPKSELEEKNVSIC